MRVSRFQIITDSKYVFENWRRRDLRTNGWRNADGKPIENADLWKEFLSARSRLRVRTDIEWTHGKRSSILKTVDKAAKAAAKRPTKSDHGFRAGKVGRTKNTVPGAAALFPAAGQRAVVRVYQSGVVVGGENKIKFQLFSEARGDFFEKFFDTLNPRLAPNYTGSTRTASNSTVIQVSNH